MDYYRPQRHGMSRKKKILIFSSITAVILAVSVTIALILVFGGKKHDCKIDSSSEHSSSSDSPNYSPGHSENSSGQSDYEQPQDSSSESDSYTGEIRRERSPSPFIHYYGDKWDLERNSRKSRSTTKKTKVPRTEGTPSKTKRKDKPPARQPAQQPSAPQKQPPSKPPSPVQQPQSQPSGGQKKAPSKPAGPVQQQPIQTPKSQPGSSQPQCENRGPQFIVRPIVDHTKLSLSEKIARVFSRNVKPPVSQRRFPPRKNKYNRITESHDTDMNFDEIFNPVEEYKNDDEQSSYVPFESIYELAGDKCRINKAFPPKGKPQGHKFECVDLVMPRPSADFKIIKLVNTLVISPSSNRKKICKITFNNKVLVEKLDDDMEFTAVFVEKMRGITLISVISTHANMERSAIQFVLTSNGRLQILTDYLRLMVDLLALSTS
ncbi:putative integral membrane protein [Theileria parva strain Muguga]|uniref:Uncharacterized protein n=1 Tax=Theileria parva TaxID=5875 RepID=Q4N5F0_THEPA|nr:putative integral membrane protein [Theileria parva strain Muguga]EAN32623.1 putative integral membrane protein [Theileria parva strain Muguga]|eukprot:XP_764906.1 hypothetical protein [Theileria parva strain Muguga]